MSIEDLLEKTKRDIEIERQVRERMNERDISRKFSLLSYTIKLVLAIFGAHLVILVLANPVSSSFTYLFSEIRLITGVLLMSIFISYAVRFIP